MVDIGSLPVAVLQFPSADRDAWSSVIEHLVDDASFAGARP
jgi:hypothetical protein